MKILVGYYSRTGNTKKMAEAIAAGVKKENLPCEMRDVNDISPDDLLDFDAIVFGSPTHYGLMAAEMKKLIDESTIHHGKLAGKIGGAFTSSGTLGGGGETTIMSIFQAFLVHGMIIVGDARMQHYGPLAIGAPDAKMVRLCTAYGRKIGQLAKKICK